MAEEPVPWSYLSELVAADDNKLYVQDGIIFECVSLCAEFMGVLEAIARGNLYEGTSLITRSVPPPEGSLAALDRNLGTLGTTLYKRLGTEDEPGSFLAVVGDMLDTFKKAAKKYQETDEGSAYDFDVDSVRPASATDVNFTPHAGDIWSEKFLKNRLENAELMENAGMECRHGDELYYVNLYSLGDYIRAYGIPGIYHDLGTTWYQRGDTLRDEKVAFVNSLDVLTDIAWDGEGRAGAIAASKAFSGQLDSLMDAIWRVADAYRFASLFLDDTEKAMPQNPHNYMGTYRDLEWGSAPYPYLDETQLGAEYQWEKDVAGGGRATRGSEYIIVVEDPTPHFRQEYNSKYAAPFETLNGFFPLLPTYNSGIDPSLTEEIPNENPYDGPVYTPSVPGAVDPAGLPPGSELNPADYGLAVGGVDSQLAEWEQAQEEAAPQQMAQTGMQAVGQALDTVQQALKDGLGAAQESLSNAGLPGALPTGGLPLGTDLAKAAGLPALKAGGPGGSLAGGTSSSTGASRPVVDPAKLFPRAGLPGVGTPLTGAIGSQTAGSPMGSPMGGSPMGGGGGGAGGGRSGQGDDKHERAKYLDRVENLDEALGDPVDMTRSVVGETGTRPATVDQPQQPVQQPRPAPPREPVRPVRPDQPVIVPRPERA